MVAIPSALACVMGPRGVVVAGVKVANDRLSVVLDAPGEERRVLGEVVIEGSAERLSVGPGAAYVSMRRLNEPETSVELRADALCPSADPAECRRPEDPAALEARRRRTRPSGGSAK